MKNNYSKVTNYQYISALSKLTKFSSHLPEDPYEIIDLFINNDIIKLPSIENLNIIYTRYPCLANFCDTKFPKTELFDLLEQYPNSYFLLYDAFRSGSEALFLAFSYDVIKTLKLYNKSNFYITNTYSQNDTIKIKQLVSINSFKLI